MSVDITNKADSIVKMEPFYEVRDESISNFKLFYSLKQDGDFVAELKTLFGLTIYAKKLPNFKKGNHLLNINLGHKKIKRGIYKFSIISDKKQISLNNLVCIP